MAILAPNGFELLKFPGQKAITNLCTNGSFETNTTGWTSTNVTLSRDTGQHHSGSASLKALHTNVGNAAFIFTTVSGTRYTISGWYKIPSGQTSITQFAVEMATGFTGTPRTIKTAVFDDWFYIECSAVATSSTASAQVDFRLYPDSSCTNGNFFYLDDVQLEVDTGSVVPIRFISTDGGTASRTYPLGEVPRFMAGKVSPFGFDYMHQGGKTTITNLVENGDIEVNVNNWGALVGVNSPTRITSDSLFGSACLQGIMGAAATNGSGISYTYTPGGVIPQKKYWVFMWWKYTFGTGSKTSQSANYKVTETGGATGAQQSAGFTFFAAMPVTPRWALLAFSFTPLQNDRTSFNIDLTASNPLVNDTFFVDGLQLVDDSGMNNSSVGGINPSTLFNTSSGAISRSYPLGQLPQGLVNPPGQQYTETGIATITLSASASDTKQSVDSGTVSVPITCSATDVKVGVDSATSTIPISASSTDVATGVDAGTSQVLLSAQTADTLQAVDSDTAQVVLSASTADAAEFVDSATALIAIASTAVEVAIGSDAATVDLSLSASAVETLIAVDTAIALLLISASAVDTYIQGSIAYYLTKARLITQWAAIALYSQFHAGITGKVIDVDSLRSGASG